MIRSRTLWLASAALLTGAGGSQAADLPVGKAAPVEYLRICDAFGEGFFYIPGSDNCLRISGQVRAEYTFRGNAPTDNAAAFAYNQAGQVYRRDLTNFRARGYLNADSRTQTAYGTLRAFVSLRVTIDTTPSGPFGGRGDTVAGIPARVSTGIFQGLPNGSQPNIDKAFIQFAGFTAGRAQSFFDFDASSYSLLANDVVNSGQITELFAYTATFGGGFSATISVEDRNERIVGDNGLFVFSNANPLNVGVPAGNRNNPTATNASILAYAGESVPDIVGNVRYDGAWGSAQLSGAYHQVRSIPVALNGAGGVGSGVTVAPEADGFAVQGGVKILLPTLAKGDSVTLQGAYETGATDYVNSVDYQPNGITNVFHSTTTGVGQQFGIPVNDAFILPNGTIGLSKAAGGFVAFRHYFIPSVYGSLYGEYVSIVNPPAAQRLGTSTDSANVWQIGGNLVYSPTKDFQIGAEVLYTNVQYRGLAATAANTPGNTTPSNPDDYRARLSFRRAF